MSPSLNLFEYNFLIFTLNSTNLLRDSVKKGNSVCTFCKSSVILILYKPKTFIAFFLILRIANLFIE